MLSLFFALHCLFSAPEDWEIADPKTPSKRALVGFLDKSKTGFCPSLNLTFEKVTIPMDEYLLTVRNHAKAKKQQWKHLGKIQTKGGQAELIEIETKSNFGQIRLLQALLRKGDDLFILTAGTLKKNFGKQAPLIEKTIRSMWLCEDLISLVQDEKTRGILRGSDEKAFQEAVLSQKDLGRVWQLLMLGKKEGKN